MVNPREVSEQLKIYANIIYKGDITKDATRQAVVKKYAKAIDRLGMMLADAKDGEVWMGDTYNHREEIKATGAKWDATAKLWVGGETDIEIRDCYAVRIWDMVVLQQTNLQMNFFGTSSKLRNIEMVAGQDSVYDIVKILYEAKLEWMAGDNLATRVSPTTLPNFATEATVSAIYDILLPILGDAEVAKLKAVELSEIQF